MQNCEYRDNVRINPQLFFAKIVEHIDAIIFH